MLSPPEAASVETHLSACPECRAEMEALRRTVAAVARLPKRKAPPGFAASVMAEIRLGAPAGEDEAVVPAKSNVVSMAAYRMWMRVAAGAAAVFLVAVGFRMLSGTEPPPEQSRGGTTASGRPDEPPTTTNGPKKTGPEANQSWQGAGVPDVKNPAGQVADRSKSKSPEEAARVPPERPPLDRALETAKAGAAKPRPQPPGSPIPAEPSELALQRITVFSSDAAADARGVSQILAGAGYTYSATSDRTLLVRVPAREAERLVASLSSMPGGFRAEARKSVEHLKEEEEADEYRRKEDLRDKQAQQKYGEKALLADAEDFQEALRRHLDDSRREIRRAKLAKAEKESGRLGLRGGVPAEGEEAPPGPAAGDVPPAADGGGVAGGGGASKAGSPGIGAERLGGATKGAGEAKRSQNAKDENDAVAEEADFAEGGTDAPDDAAAAERAREAKLVDALKKLEEVERRVNHEEAVVLVIEFAPPPAPAADPAGK
jgi:hypothetical protein